MQALIEGFISILDFVISHIRNVVWLVAHIPEYAGQVMMAVGYLPDFLTSPVMVGLTLILFFAVIKIF